MSEERKGEKKVSRRGVVGAITAGIAGLIVGGVIGSQAFPREITKRDNKN